MFLLKKVVLGILFVILMFLGGNAVQSDSATMQGVGFIGIIAALAIFFIIWKLLWFTMGFFMKIFVFAGIVLFILYSLGMFGNGGSIKDYLESEGVSVSENMEQNVPEQQEVAQLMKADVEIPDEGILEKAKRWLLGAEKTQINFNPMDYPAVKGPASVITAGVLKVNGYYVKLLGIEAPELQQTCSNRRGSSYHCGQKAVRWLQNWINNREVECRLVGRVQKNWVSGVCFLGESDIAAAVVKAGWAVAYTKNIKAYVPYEQDAMENKKGMWEGQFYRPSDWRKLQTRSAEVKVENKDSSSSWFDFGGVF